MTTWQTRIGGVLRDGLRSRVVWAFAVVYLASVALLAASADIPALGLFYNLGLTLFVVPTLIVTDAAPHNRERATWRLYAQIAVIGAVIIVTGIEAMAFHDLTAPPRIPIWSDVDSAIGSFSFEQLGSSNFLSNPWRYFVVPFILLLLLGARPGELGLGRGHRVWLVTAIWCAIPLLLIIYAGISGASSFERLGRLFVSNALNNGFFEEFLFRGALQTRLRKRMRPGWAIVITGLAFGLWHLGLGYSTFGESGLLAAAASTIVYQSFSGVVFGILFERTRNLIAPSIVHVVLNVVGGVIGS